MILERIKQKACLLLAVCLIGTSLLGKSDRKDEELFDLAREQLAKREIENALNSLRILYVKDRTNANLNFLMGAAYTEMGNNGERAIYHLKKALKNIDENYEVGAYEEKDAPVHTYYYLTVALASLDDCEKAAAAADKLRKYSNKIDEYFIEECDRHMQKCPFEKRDPQFDKWLNKIELPEAYDPEMIEPIETIEIKDADSPNQLAGLDSSKKAEMGIVTKELEYTTDAPLYGVQIGSGTKPSPISRYSKMKNVDVFVDKQGIIRYVVGHFSYRNQAESLLEKLRSEGHSDAFVVDVNDERKYSNELISYNYVNLRAGISGKIEYYVQLGAFSDEVPEHLMKLYLQVDHIREVNYQEMTLMLVGSFSKFTAATQSKEELQELNIEGIEDAFVVAFNKGKKISLEEAIRYTE